LALAGGEWSVSRPDRFNPGGKSPGDWVGPRTGLDAVVKKKNLTIATAGNLTPVVQLIA